MNKIDLNVDHMTARNIVSVLNRAKQTISMAFSPCPKYRVKNPSLRLLPRIQNIESKTLFSVFFESRLVTWRDTYGSDASHMF